MPHRYASRGGLARLRTCCGGKQLPFTALMQLSWFRRIQGGEVEIAAATILVVLMERLRVP